MTNRIDIRELFGRKPFMIYPFEVNDSLDFYRLAALAAGMVKTDPAMKDVHQFIFIMKGGLASKVIKIGEKDSSIIELAGDLRMNSLIRQRGRF